ncbi:MAG TPA: prenyltransferase/squalene oxidase repeat-containing protein [Pirellulales bacterium]
MPPAGVAALQLGAPSRARAANPVVPAEEDQGLNILIALAQNAPAWLISAVVHTSLLIILGVGLVAVEHTRQIEPPGINLTDQIGDTLDESALSSTAGSQAIEKADTQILTPQNLPHVAEPFATPPQATDIRLGGILPSSGDLHAPTIGLALNGREAGMKNVLLGVYGGTGTTETAVAQGLEWLIRQQRADGMWSLSGPYSDHALADNPYAATAMALLAFQGAGITPGKGKYAKAVDKGWVALLKAQQRDGSFGVNMPPRQSLYTHAQCTIALCEVYGMTQDSHFYEPAQRAIAFCVASQDKKGGGWRYDFSDSDTSVTGWFVMALKSAQMARFDVPQQVFYEVTRYLDSAARSDGNYGYTPNSPSTQAVTAEAYLCRQLLGWKQNDPRLIDACKVLTANAVKYDPADRDVYYWYYATQVCHNMEGPIWEKWNTAMRAELPQHQVKGGAEAGSWSPQGDRWSIAGRLYTTCLSIYMLEVYYRHLPIYSAYKYGK